MNRKRPIGSKAPTRTKEPADLEMRLKEEIRAVELRLNARIDAIQDPWPR